jgi:hypothetical protein
MVAAHDHATIVGDAPASGARDLVDQAARMQPPEVAVTVMRSRIQVLDSQGKQSVFN